MKKDSHVSSRVNKGISPEEREIIKRALNAIPPNSEIVTRALTESKKRSLRPRYVESDFSKSLLDLHDSVYLLFLEEQEKAQLRAIEGWLHLKKERILALSKDTERLRFAEGVILLSTPFISSLELSLGNSRKSRAGYAFEIMIRELLSMLAIPCEKPTGEASAELKRIDLVVPDLDTAINRRDQAFFLSCKRTLRERWKQIGAEFRRSGRVYLLTIDTDISEEKAHEIDSEELIAYVPDRVKLESHLRDKPWIRSLSSLPKDLGTASKINKKP